MFISAPVLIFFILWLSFRERESCCTPHGSTSYTRALAVRELENELERRRIDKWCESYHATKQ